MSETKSAEYKAAKLTRRNAKASLTRSGRALLHRIENKWSIEEIKVMLINVDKVYNDLVEKHEKFTELVEDDEEFEAEERWLEECQQQFLSFESRAKKYIDET
jgi:kynurenine formamidase